MAEDPKAFIRRVSDQDRFGAAGAHRLEWMRTVQLQREAQAVLANIHEHRVFFYPGAGRDWEPLHRLTHLCETFIFCDPGVAPRLVHGDFGLEGVATDFIVSLDSDTVAYLSATAPLPGSIARTVEHFGLHTASAWGKYARITRSVGNVRKSVHFFYLGMEGLTAFFNLFAPAKASPQMLCMKFGMDPHGRYFADWNGHLGDLVRKCKTKPTHLVGCGGPESKWPYPKLWQHLARWLSVWVAEDYVADAVQARPLDGTRRVIARRGALSPVAVEGCEAVVLPMGLYLAHVRSWPERAKILLLAPHDQAGQVPDHKDIVAFLGSGRAPLEEILVSLARTCDRLGIRRVASVGIGYEDEGPALDEWRKQPGLPLELTIYCQHDGDVLSLGPYADEIR